MKHSIVTLSLCATLLASVQALAAEKAPEFEKCYGVAKAGKNDCAAKDKSNSCAGQAKTDANPNDWVYVPKGLCDKLANGVLG